MALSVAARCQCDGGTRGAQQIRLIKQSKFNKKSLTLQVLNKQQARSSVSLKLLHKKQALDGREKAGIRVRHWPQRSS